MPKVGLLPENTRIQYLMISYIIHSEAWSPGGERLSQTGVWQDAGPKVPLPSGGGIDRREGDVLRVFASEDSYA